MVTRQYYTHYSQIKLFPYVKYFVALGDVELLRNLLRIVKEAL